MGRKRDAQIAEMVGKPISEKMDKVEEAVRRDGEQTRAEYKKQIGEVKQVVDAVLDDLSSREKKELYDLNTLVDIADLDDTEKEFLLAVLYTLSDMTEEVTETQQGYIRSVKKYLGLKDVQTKVDLSCIENIDSKKEERAILQCVMEFLFLENCNHDYWNEYDDVLDYFNVKNSETRKIQASIDAIYKAVGAVGLAEKYGYSEEDDEKEDDIEEIDPSEATITGSTYDEIKSACKGFIHTHMPSNYKASNILIENLSMHEAVFSADEVYLAHDDTLFGTGKKGFAITRQGICCNKDGVFPRHSSLRELAASSRIYCEGSNIYADAHLIACFSGGSSEKADLVSLFCEIRMMLRRDLKYTSSAAHPLNVVEVMSD